ncbi:BREX-1 system adenine-specific DNA-methyltransferase PglX [Streptacidiphilus anmyonensis]|uniref:BREX-1 system adenine-specific DNA-methyltransferase PglX n=1 Tax=Streptacidiphilus anmyonensis TaxID=405782 RepID=UPI0005A9A5D2|nr:BREX-1 system adenine-specific DNA-methyltransferase PglX [Streptacidiphilus anmyonensis]
METAPLKSFATWARTALVREVAARIAVVLAPASSERVEQRSAVAALEKAVNATGGGDTGRAAVADKVAYTWFNRIIALRFMDANGYTGINVVSSERGREGGQPEVLAEAKRGNIDSTVVTDKRTVEIVTTLLNGTRRSDDPQGEAYSLLLAEYCRHWNRSMPFMFEREGDYTELLIPANLLADDSVLAGAVSVLTEDVCQDVEAIGWLYQFYISERKDEVFAGFKKNKKAGAAEIPAATQLFTPHWIVRYLVENSLGRLWLLNRPASRLVDRMDYYIAPIDEETDYPKVSSPEELKIIDPACGSGHMLTYAFDLLYAIYEEEGYAPSDIPRLILANNLHGTEIDPRAGALAAFALVMKARARQRTFFNKQIEPNICVLEPISFRPGELDLLVTRSGDRADEEAFWNQFQHADAFGSLIRPREDLTARLRLHLDTHLSDTRDLIGNDIEERARRVVLQAEYLGARYHAIVANPPYMGSGNMNAQLNSFIKAEFPRSNSDLFAAFIDRNIDLSVPGGRVAMVTMQSWMFLSSFAKLRKWIADRHRLLAMAHLGTNAFGSIGGEVVSTTAFVIGVDSPRESTLGTYVRLAGSANESAKAEELRRIASGGASANLYRVRNADLAALPGAVIAYWLSEPMIKAFSLGRPLVEIGEPRQGLITSDNNRFTRIWSEVSWGSFGRGLSRQEAADGNFQWLPLNKGGGPRKWYGNQEFVVNWRNDGAEIRSFGIESGRPRSRVQNTAYYFLPAVSWSKIGTGIPTFRYYPEGFIFDVAGMSIFASEPTLLHLAAICNSSVAGALLAATSPTLNFEVGALAQLPVVDISEESRNSVNELVRLHRADWNEQETSWDFSSLSIIAQGGSRLDEAVNEELNRGIRIASRVQELETRLNVEIAKAYGLEGEVETDVPLSGVTLNGNPVYRFGAGKSAAEQRKLYAAERVNDLISYAIACMFGRYSLDEPGLILAEQGDTLQDYAARVSNPSFMPATDNVIPIVDGDWFEDDIVARFRQFLRAAFGGQHFEENLKFVTDSLGVKNLRDYFVKSFYKDHVQRYKKRPIYWLFSSPKGSFNALIYMHRYSPSTASTVLNEYLREFKAKLEASRRQHERRAVEPGTPREKAGAQKEVDRLRKVLLELDEYEHDVLYPLATRQVQIDLDDGVKANYPKLGAALKKIPGLEASDD